MPQTSPASPSRRFVISNVNYNEEMRKKLMLANIGPLPTIKCWTQCIYGPSHLRIISTFSPLDRVVSAAYVSLPLLRISDEPISCLNDSSLNRCFLLLFLLPLSRCQPSLQMPHPPSCPTTHKPCWCTHFDLLVLSSSPCCFTNVYQTRSPLLVYL
jgi:hypothetical protein